MDLFIPYAYTPYEGGVNFGVFSTRALAEAILKEEKDDGDYETYDIYTVQLDTKDVF